MTATKENLDIALGFLNTHSNKKYGIYYAYGKSQLVRLYNGGGQTPVSNFITRSELLSLINAITIYAIEENEK